MARVKQAKKTTQKATDTNESPEFTYSTTERLQVIANLIVDCIIEDQKNGIIRATNPEKVTL